MGRPLRPNSPGSWYHVFNRGAARQEVFRHDRDRTEFLRLLGVAHERFDVTVHAYCLMGNHYHLLVECSGGGLSEAMHVVGSQYVRHFNERVGRDGPLFRDRFSDRHIESDDYLRHLVTYIHRNPLAFVSPSELRSYRWSSLRVYTGARRAPRWMALDAVLSLFGTPEEVERAAVSEDAGGGVGSLHAQDWWIDAIELAVDEYIHDGTRQSAARSVAVLLSREPRFASLVSFPSPGAERMAVVRAERRAQQQPEIRDAAIAALRLIA